MNYYYTDEKNAQIVIALLKKHGIRKIVASPGTTNICLVSSIQRDSFFEVYSAPEERSGAYIACGLSAECGEPVVITCTGATASRNYFPALTEAYYRKLPILAITCSRRGTRIGHNIDQVTDRTQLPKDIAKMTVQVPLVYDQESEWGDVIAVNKAILELSHHGNGPVHINLETNYSTNYSVQQLPDIRAIYRLNESEKNKFPEIKGKKIAVMIGSHLPWNDKLEQFVELFSNAKYVITDTFHGLVFSIIMNKQVTLIVRNNSFKVLDLLKDLEIPYNIDDTIEKRLNDMENCTINYKEVNKKLSKLRRESNQYLLNLLEKGE